MKKVLVTGCAGFIMSHLVDLLLEDEDTYIVGIDNLSKGSEIKNMPIDNPRFQWYEYDLCELISSKTGTTLEYIFNNYKFDGVIHGAAQTFVDRSIDHPSYFIQNNIQSTVNLLDCVRQYCPKARYLQVSTDEVYGAQGRDYWVTAETFNACHPGNPYAASKAAADMVVESYWRTYNLNVTITRCANNFGPRQNKEKFLPKIINNTLNNEKIPVFYPGTQRRNWLYVTDHCKAIKLVYEKGNKLVYNVSGKTDLTNLDLVTKILNYLGKSSDLIEFVPDRPAHDWAYSISNSVQLLDWEAGEFEDQLQETIEWYKDEFKRCS